MNANEARKVAVKAKSNGLNYQVRKTIESIRWRAERGETYLVLDNMYVHLFDEDFETLEKMGYRVTKPKLEDNMFYFGRVDW